MELRAAGAVTKVSKKGSEIGIAGPFKNVFQFSQDRWYPFSSFVFPDIVDVGFELTVELRMAVGSKCCCLYLLNTRVLIGGRGTPHPADLLGVEKHWGKEVKELCPSVVAASALLTKAVWLQTPHCFNYPAAATYCCLRGQLGMKR